MPHALWRAPTAERSGAASGDPLRDEELDQRGAQARRCKARHFGAPTGPHGSVRAFADLRVLQSCGCLGVARLFVRANATLARTHPTHCCIARGSVCLAGEPCEGRRERLAPLQRVRTSISMRSHGHARTHVHTHAQPPTFAHAIRPARTHADRMSTLGMCWLTHTHTHVRTHTHPRWVGRAGAAFSTR